MLDRIAAESCTASPVKDVALEVGDDAAPTIIEPSNEPQRESERMDVEPALERRFLGEVEVDTGTLLIGDPGYCLPHTMDGTPGIDYETIIAAPDQPASYLGGKAVILLGQFGGDGTFPVYGEIDESGQLVRVTIEFVGPEDAEPGGDGDDA